MSNTLIRIFSFACLLPLLIGLIRYKKIDKKYHPFIYVMLADFTIELLLLIFNKSLFPKSYNNVAFHIYFLLYFYFSLQFCYTNKFISKKITTTLLAIALPVMLFNDWFNNWVMMFPYYFLSFMSAVMLFMYINILSKQVLAVNSKLRNNFWFWVSSFSILYHAFTLLIFGLYFFSLFNTPNGRSILEIHHYVNALSYIAFAFAILIIPAKNNFSTSKQH
jgi:hypothetical protein